jgi:hypothetical protein
VKAALHWIYWCCYIYSKLSPTAVAITLHNAVLFCFVLFLVFAILCVFWVSWGDGDFEILRSDAGGIGGGWLVAAGDW